MNARRPPLMAMAAMGVLCLLNIGCTCSALCNRRARKYGTVPNTFERYVIVGHGDKPRCPIPGTPQTPELVPPGQPVTIWFRAVYKDAVNKPVGGVEISVSLVDDFGSAIPVVPPMYYLQPAKVSTAADGFYFGSVVFISQNPGHFRIKAQYTDKNANATTYGEVIIVQ